MSTAKVKRFAILGGRQRGVWVNLHAANGINGLVVCVHLFAHSEMNVNQRIWC
jgi:hypothetical protein